MNTLEQLGHGRNNNFNLIRMIAASCVLVSHSYPLALGPNVTEPLARAGISLGGMALIVFFGISGFFVTKSAHQYAQASDFLSARALRIFPGFAVSLIVTAYIIAPFASSLPLQQYLTRAYTARYVFANLTFVDLQLYISKAFDENVYKGVVNGSLWTLRYEVGLYLVCLLFSLLTRDSARKTAIFITLVLFYYGVDRIMTGKIIPTHERILIAPFLIGMLGYVFRRHVPIGLPYAAGLFLLLLLLRSTAIYFEMLCIALIYASFVAGFTTSTISLIYNRVGDYSFGMYIYAFPIQQLIVHFAPSVTPVQLMAVAFVAVLIVSILSWHLVEHPALRLKANHQHRTEKGKREPLPLAA